LTTQPRSETPQRPSRDGRLDLARGLTMLIIFVAHVPGNPWSDFIPARMGFSSGAEAFVLCSGLASGIAFGGTFRREGWMPGTRRVGRRVWQLWLAQVLTFAAFAAMLLMIDRATGSGTLTERYGLERIVAEPFGALADVALLRFIPLYFDILPLYIVVLAMIPPMVVLSARAPSLALSFSFLLWFLAQILPWNLTAETGGGRSWYFNPLAWQFLFFIGFAVTSGWVRVPRATPSLVAAAVLFLAGSMLLSFWAFHAWLPWTLAVFTAIYPADAITTVHPLRLVHVLVLGWLFAVLLGPFKDGLEAGPLKPIVRVGQQALITFLTGLFLSALAGVTLDLSGRSFGAVAGVNLAGFVLLIAAAAISRSVKSRLSRREAPKGTVPCASPR
jgi:hypothetical protein